MIYRNSRHIYELTFQGGKKDRIFTKNDLINFLKENKNVIKIEYYVSNGNWKDVTKQYIKG